MDLSILIFIQNFRLGILDTFFSLITHLGSAGIFWVLLLGVLLIHKPTRYIAVGGIIALLISTLIVNGILKPLVNRSRPYTVYDIDLLVKKPTDSSFPSGHTAASMVVAVYLWCWKVKYRTVYMTLAILISFSRLYLFVHYPSDVLVGALIGSIVGYGTYRYFYARKDTLWLSLQ